MSGILGTTDDRVMSGRVPLWFNLFLVPADKADYVLGKFTHIAKKIHTDHFLCSTIFWCEIYSLLVFFGVS